MNTPRRPHQLTFCTYAFLFFSIEQKKLYKEKMKRNDAVYKEGLQMLGQLKDVMEVLCINKDPSVVDEMQEMWHKQHRRDDPEGNI